MNNAALCVKPYAENPHKRCHGLTLTALAMLCAVGHAHAVFAGVLSASNYVQSGLIAHWDGLENAGSGKHESGATVWKDLSGKGNDLTCTSGNYSWGEKWFYANAHGSGVVESAKANKAITNYQTIEIVFRSDSGKDGKRGIVCSGNKSKVHYLIYANKVLQMAESQPALALPDMFADTTAAATYASGTATAASSVFLNGKSQTASTYSETWGTYPSVFSVAYGKTSGYAFCGRIYAIRLYSRALTETELAANAMCDRVRFFGGRPDATHVWTGEAGDGKWSTPGNWSANTVPGEGDSVQIVNNTTAVLSIAVPASCSWLKSLDLSGDGPISFSGTGTVRANLLLIDDENTVKLTGCSSLSAKACSVNGEEVGRGVYSGEGAVGTQVDWLGGTGAVAVGGGLLKTPLEAVLGEWTASGYVQSGLIAQWDGLENAGKGINDPSATSWKDLSGKGNDLTCTSGNYSWGEKWFYANAHGSGVVESAKANKAITNYQTIEIVFRSDSGKDGKRGIVCSGNKSKVHYLIYANKVLQMAESQPALALPDMFADTTAAATYASGTATAASSVFLNGKSQTASTYSETWGTYPSVFSVAYGKTSGHAFCGRIYAIRLYDRVLTAVELRANAKRDGIRFFGKEPSPGLSILIR